MSATPATDRLRAWIEERSRGDALDAYRGHDWMQLTEAEEEVFGLALADMAAVSTVFHEWEALIGRVDGELWPEMPSAAIGRSSPSKTAEAMPPTPSRHSPVLTA